MRLLSGARVIDRGDGTWQMGSRDAAVFSCLTAAERRFLERLDLARHVSERAAREHPRIVDALRAACLFEAPPASSARIGFDGAGGLATAIGTVAAAAGFSLRFDDERSCAGIAGSEQGAATRQSAAAAAIRHHVPTAVTSVGAGLADAWVISSEGAPRLEAAVRLMAADVPHVFVVATERGVDVGPVVLPGASACGTCHGIARAEADAAWPIVALGLGAPSLSRPQPDEAVSALAAGLVVAALKGALGRDAEPWVNTWWELTPRSWQRPLPIEARTDCGCGAAGPVGDDVAARRTRLAPAR